MTIVYKDSSTQTPTAGYVSEEQLRHLNCENILNELNNLDPSPEVIKCLANIISDYEKENSAFQLRLDKYMKISDDRDKVEKHLLKLDVKIKALQDALRKMQMLALREKERANSLLTKYETVKLKDDENRAKIRRLLEMTQDKNLRNVIQCTFNDPKDLLISQRFLGECDDYDELQITMETGRETRVSRESEEPKSTHEIRRDLEKRITALNRALERQENIARERFAMMEEEHRVSLLERDTKTKEYTEKINELGRMLRDREKSLHDVNVELSALQRSSKNKLLLSFAQGRVIDYNLIQAVDDISWNDSVEDIQEKLRAALRDSDAMREELEQCLSVDSSQLSDLFDKLKHKDFPLLMTPTKLSKSTQVDIYRLSDDRVPGEWMYRSDSSVLLVHDDDEDVRSHEGSVGTFFPFRHSPSSAPVLPSSKVSVIDSSDRRSIVQEAVRKAMHKRASQETSTQPKVAFKKLESKIIPTRSTKDIETRGKKLYQLHDDIQPFFHRRKSVEVGPQVAKGKRSVISTDRVQAEAAKPLVVIGKQQDAYHKEPVGMEDLHTARKKEELHKLSSADFARPTDAVVSDQKVTLVGKKSDDMGDVIEICSDSDDVHHRSIDEVRQRSSADVARKVAVEKTLSDTARRVSRIDVQQRPFVDVGRRPVPVDSYQEIKDYDEIQDNFENIRQKLIVRQRLPADVPQKVAFAARQKFIDAAGQVLPSDDQRRPSVDVGHRPVSIDSYQEIIRMDEDYDKIQDKFEDIRQKSIARKRLSADVPQRVASEGREIFLDTVRQVSSPDVEQRPSADIDHRSVSIDSYQEIIRKDEDYDEKQDKFEDIRQKSIARQRSSADVPQKVAVDAARQVLSSDSQRRPSADVGHHPVSVDSYQEVMRKGKDYDELQDELEDYQMKPEFRRRSSSFVALPAGTVPTDQEILEHDESPATDEIQEISDVAHPIETAVSDQRISKRHGNDDVPSITSEAQFRTYSSHTEFQPDVHTTPPEEYVKHDRKSCSTCIENGLPTRFPIATRNVTSHEMINVSLTHLPSEKKSDLSHRGKRVSSVLQPTTRRPPSTAEFRTLEKDATAAPIDIIPLSEQSRKGELPTITRYPRSSRDVESKIYKPDSRDYQKGPPRSSITIDEIAARAPKVTVQPDGTIQVGASASVSEARHETARQPSVQTARQPSVQIERQPSVQIARQPSVQPARHLSVQPAKQPSVQPARQPPVQPARQPSVQPAKQPSVQPARQPPVQPARQPSVQPTRQPSVQPERQPSVQPARQPSVQQERQPSMQQERQPSVQQERQPSVQQERQPSVQQERQPSVQQEGQPSVQPIRQPSVQPERPPSVQPIRQPSVQPERQPSVQPERQPSVQPTRQPSVQPERQPSVQPARQPSVQPIRQPSVQPAKQPSVQTARQPPGYKEKKTEVPVKRITQIPYIELQKKEEQSHESSSSSDYIALPEDYTYTILGEDHPDVIKLVSHEECDEAIKDLSKEVEYLVSRNEELQQSYSNYRSTHDLCHDKYNKMKQDLDFERSHRDAYIHPLQKQNADLIERLKLAQKRIKRMESRYKSELEGCKTDVKFLKEAMMRMEKDLMKSVLLLESNNQDLEVLHDIHQSTKKSLQVTKEVKRLKIKLYQIESEIRAL